MVEGIDRYSFGFYYIVKQAVLFYIYIMGRFLFRNTLAVTFYVLDYMSSESRGYDLLSTADTKYRYSFFRGALHKLKLKSVPLKAYKSPMFPVRLISAERRLDVSSAGKKYAVRPFGQFISPEIVRRQRQPSGRLHGSETGPRELNLLQVIRYRGRNYY